MAEQDQLPADVIPPAIIPDTNDAAPGPIEIDIDAGEVVEAPQASEVQTPQDGGDGQQPQKRTPRSQVRIQNLSAENQRLAQELQELRREAEEAKRAANEASAARDTAERAGMENYGARVKSDLASAKTEVAQAIAANDATALVEAQAKLAKAAAAEADYDAWAQAHPKQEPQQQPQQRQQQQQQYRQPQQQQPQISEPVRNFMQENPWFNPYQIDQNGMIMTDQRGQPLENPDFDPDMRDAALLRDAQIKREIRQGRKPQDFLESEDYFNDIYTHVNNAFPDAFEDEPQQRQPAPPQQRPRTPPMQPGRQPVAPVQRQAMPGQQPQKSGNRVQLSGEERSFVDSLVDNGTMRYPREHPDPNKRGQKMTKQDAYVKYAKERAADQAVRGTGGN